MQTNDKQVFRFNLNDIQRMVFEAVRRLRMPLDESIKWNYETCYDEAKKYKSKGEFKKNNATAYQTARKNGWLNDYTWFKRPVVSIIRKWTREACYDEAKKYKSRGEFSKNSPNAYNSALKNGWLDDYTWFNSNQKQKGYWNKENCYNEAKKYKTRRLFHIGSKGAYAAAWKNGWLDDYTWFEDGVKIAADNKRKWNREACYDEAKKYKTYPDFRINSKGAYAAAYKNGWLGDYTWLEKGRISEKNIYAVYYYEDKDTNAVYVGLTNNLKRRHRQHCKGILKHGEFKYDIVYKYWHDTLGKEVPEPIVIHKDIYAKDAQEYEKKYIEKFKNEGKLVLNIAKAGSLGAYGKWTKEKCYDEAKKYKSRGEFAKRSNVAYNVALKNGWLDEYTWFEKIRGAWTKEKCYDEAKKYKSSSEFFRKNRTAYTIAWKNGWLDEYDWFKNPHIKWTKESCYNEAKKYKSRWDFGKNSTSAYNAAKKNGWLKDYTWFEKPREKWNRETCYDEAKKYKSVSEFHKASKGAYKAAWKNGWLADYTWFQRPSRSN